MQTEKTAHLNRPHLMGGSWTYKPTTKCDNVTQSGVAIIIVIRDRWTQFTNVLHTLIPLLQNQRLCYRLFVIEQAGQELFNRGMLFNVGFMEAINRFNFECVIFHDADLAPINDLNPYGCDQSTFKKPIHLGVGIDVRKFRLNYKRLIGGVLKMTNKHFVKINGYSNLYWGWGQEDDDLERRLRTKRIDYIQMSPSIARYKAIFHKAQKKTGNIRKLHISLLKTAAKHIDHDGLTSLNYEVLQVKYHELFTYILVDLGPLPEIYKC